MQNESVVSEMTDPILRGTEDEVSVEEAFRQLQKLHYQLGWASHRRLELELEQYQLTVPQFMVMKCIRETGHGCSMTYLAERSYQVTATMTGIVDRLVERDLVKRERNPKDRRALWVLLTPKGETLLCQVNAFRREWMEKFVQSLSAADRGALMRISDQYLAVIDETFLGSQTERD